MRLGWRRGESNRTPGGPVRSNGSPSTPTLWRNYSSAERRGRVGTRNIDVVMALFGDDKERKVKYREINVF
jgi:hypothetical protein